MSLRLPNLEFNRSLAPLTTYQIGGPADFFVETHSIGELGHAVREARRAGIAYFLLGSGANILVTDKGFRGLVIHNSADNVAFTDGSHIRAESGTIIAELIVACRDRGLSGLEHYVGIPSTVGGALWQNLHFLSPAPARERTLFIREIVESATVLTKDLEVKTVSVEYFKFAYDFSTLRETGDIVFDVTFRLEPKSREDIQRVMDENMSWRIAKQPQLEEFASCGSMFKKIEGAGAGRLIDAAGLKGTRIGGASISNKHANYFINDGTATAADVLSLMELTREKVKEKTGYWLEPEISVIGEQ